jgi:hypothetical protein
MKIELTQVSENPDGSANLTVEYDQEGLQILLQTAVEKIIMDYIIQEKEKHESQPKRRKTPPAVIQSNKRNNSKRRNGVVQ